MTARWMVALRLSRRLVRRSLGRSVLIATLVAIPVLAGTVAAVTIRTAHLSPGEATQRALGRADAIAFVRSHGFHSDVAVGRDDSGDTISNIPYDEKPVATDTQWAKALPAGSRVTPAAWLRRARVATGSSTADVQGVALDLADPMTAGIFRVTSGRAPTGGDEVALTDSLADRLGVGVGSHVTLVHRPVLVTAVVEDPRSLAEDQVVAPAAAFGGLDAGRNPWYGNAGYWLIDTPSSAPDLHDALLADGVVYETRHQWTFPRPGLAPGSQVAAEVLIVLGTVVGFGLLEVLLLAGAAFAVATRRQTRELGLLSATGGDADDVRRTVLAQGVWLGVAGALAGVAGGVAAFLLLRGVLERAAERRFGALDVAVTDLLALAALGVVAGLLAAVVPARAAAGRPALDMLRERFDAKDARAALPRWSVAAIIGGAALTAISAYMWHRNYGTLRSTTVGTGSATAVFRGLGTTLSQNRWPAGLWLGAAVTLAGLVRACPVVVSHLGARSGRLPVGPRLALRDAGRHRHRTGPAIAAVMTVVAGATLVLFVVSSNTARDRSSYTPGAPIGTISVNANSNDPADLSAAVDAVKSAVPSRATAEFGRITYTVTLNHHRERLPLIAEGGCEFTTHSPSSTAGCPQLTVGVTETAALATLAGHDVPAAEHALDNGAAVVVAPALPEPRVHLVQPAAHGDTHDVLLPATLLEPGHSTYGGLPDVLVSPETARAHGWGVTPDTTLITPVRVPSKAEIDRLQHGLGRSAYLFVERGYHTRSSIVLLALLGAASIATLAGTSIAVALAMAESRADMSTLAAVGASPARRRLHAMGQAATVGGLGTLLGVALGSFLAVATLAGSPGYPTSVPVRWVLALVVGGPLLSMAVAAAFTRSRVTLTRRIA